MIIVVTGKKSLKLAHPGHSLHAPPSHLLTKIFPEPPQSALWCLDSFCAQASW